MPKNSLPKFWPKLEDTHDGKEYRDEEIKINFPK
jgi:hypothetical protein